VSTLDGLTQSTNIGLQFSHVHFSIVGEGETDVNDPVVRANCRDIIVEIVAAEHLLAGKVEKLKAVTVLPSENASCDRPIIDAALTDVKADIAQFDATHSLDDDDIGSAAVKLRDQAEKEETTKYLASLKTAQGTLGLGWIASLNARYGYAQHTFYDSKSLLKEQPNYYPFQVGGNITILPPVTWARFIPTTGTFSINLGANFQKTIMDSMNSTQQVECKATTAPIIKCVNGYIGPPTVQDKYLLSFDIRYVDKLFKLPFGIDPGVTYDARSGQYAFQFPVYLFENSSKSLAGGIRYDWTNVKHESVVGLFVSSAFGVAPTFTSNQPAAKTGTTDQ